MYIYVCIYELNTAKQNEKPVGLVLQNQYRGPLLLTWINFDPRM